jgi:hypothetical protein
MNQRGQFVIESVLLMVLLTGMMLAFVNIMRTNDVLAKIVESPWEKTSGMIESGIWAPPQEARTKAPYTYDRFYSPVSD